MLPRRRAPRRNAPGSRRVRRPRSTNGAQIGVSGLGPAGDEAGGAGQVRHRLRDEVYGVGPQLPRLRVSSAGVAWGMP